MSAAEELMSRKDQSKRVSVILFEKILKIKKKKTFLVETTRLIDSQLQNIRHVYWGSMVIREAFRRG